MDNALLPGMPFSRKVSQENPPHQGEGGWGKECEWLINQLAGVVVF